MTLARTIPLMLLLLAACASSPTGNGGGDDEFIAEDAAPDANPESAAEAPRPEEKLAPLTSDEEGKAAVLVARLEQAGDEERDGLIEELVELGPRYLAFLRSIESDAAGIDLLYVIRRIERTHNVDQETGRTEANENGAAREPDAAGPEPDVAAPEIPDYGPDVEDFDRAAVERFLRLRLQQARNMMDRGSYSLAIRTAEAAIVIMPDTVLRPDFEALIREARGESQAELLIAGTLSLTPDHLQYDSTDKGSPFKDALQIRCFLKNVSTQDITLRLYDGEDHESILQLAVTYEQLDYQGNVMAQRGNVRLPLDGGESVTLTPNESYSLTVPLHDLSALDADAPRKPALGRVEINSALRVFEALDGNGDPMVLRPVQFPRRRVLVFPAGFDLKAAGARPLDALRQAIENGNPQDLYLAAHLVGKDDRRAAGDALFKDYDRSVLAMQRARLASLSVIFDIGRSWEIKRWREWWAENRLRQ